MKSKGFIVVIIILAVYAVLATIYIVYLKGRNASSDPAKGSNENATPTTVGANTTPSPAGDKLTPTPSPVPVIGETDKEKLTLKQAELIDKVPAYFGLDATNGLDVYVWQMAKDSYSFALLPHSEEERDWLSSEMLGLKGVSRAEMYAILATYAVDESKVYIVPWQNPFSSYIPGYRVIHDNVDAKTLMEDYKIKVKKMLYPDSAGQSSKSKVQLFKDLSKPDELPFTIPDDVTDRVQYYEAALGDIDEDGEDELYLLGYIPLSSTNSFVLAVIDGDDHYCFSYSGIPLLGLTLTESGGRVVLNYSRMSSSGYDISYASYYADTYVYGVLTECTLTRVVEISGLGLRATIQDLKNPGRVLWSEGESPVKK
jgi:hypothetical protein